MKKNLILIFIVVAVFSASCKKNKVTAIGVYSQLEIIPSVDNKIPVGQLVLFYESFESDSSAVTYYDWSIVGPNGSEKVDSKQGTGVASWIPEAPGQYDVVVKMKTAGYEDYQRSATINVVKSDFGYALWGYSADDINVNEVAHNSKPVTISSDEVAYLHHNGDLYGYEINSTGMYEGAVVYGVKYSSANSMNYISDYSRIKDSLSDIYGTPFKDTTIWTNTAFKAYPDKWGQALENGEVSFLSGWNSGNASVVLELNNSDNNILFGALFQEKQ